MNFREWLVIVIFRFFSITSCNVFSYSDA